MTQFVSEHRIKAVPELGFGHGVSTCYVAAALARTDGGSVVTIDLERARNRSPIIEELLERPEGIRRRRLGRANPVSPRAGEGAC